jgi:hypothetical protein
MHQWNYDIQFVTLDDRPLMEEDLQKLNELGTEGWEAISMAFLEAERSGEMHKLGCVILKRRVR